MNNDAYNLLIPSDQNWRENLCPDTKFPAEKATRFAISVGLAVELTRFDWALLPVENASQRENY